MKQNVIQIGFSQRIQLPWLEYTAGLVKTGKSRNEINDALQDYLSDKLSIGGSAVRGNREKAITILHKIWQGPPDELMALRDEGLNFLARIPSAQHVAVHWGMAMAVYPFFGAVADLGQRDSVETMRQGVDENMLRVIKKGGTER